MTLPHVCFVDFRGKQPLLLGHSGLNWWGFFWSRSTYPKVLRVSQYVAYVESLSLTHHRPYS